MTDTSLLFRLCPDGNRCENGSLCMEAQEGNYYCDCATASGGDFAGLSCEFEAETYCRLPDETTSSWFCCNQGTCTHDNNGFSCDCPSEYEGSHCEYIAGALPADWPGLTADQSSSSANQRGRGKSSDGGLQTGVIVAIVLVSIVVGAMLSFLVMMAIRRRQKHQDEMDELDNKDNSKTFRRAGRNAPKDASEALHIEMDGSGFRDAVLTSGRSGNGISSEPFDFDTGEVEFDSELGPAKMNGKNNNNNHHSIKPNGGGQSTNGHGMML